MKGGGIVAAKNVKEYLKQYRETMERSAEIIQHLQELKVEAIKLKDHTGKSIALDDAVNHYVDACNDSAAELNALAAKRSEILGCIDSVKDKAQRAVLYRHYINGESWERIAVDMDYCIRQVYRIHGGALVSISRNFHLLKK
jgi:hypothetical protein